MEKSAAIRHSAGRDGHCCIDLSTPGYYNYPERKNIQALPSDDKHILGDG